MSARYALKGSAFSKRIRADVGAGYALLQSLKREARTGKLASRGTWLKARTEGPKRADKRGLKAERADKRKPKAEAC